MIAAHEARKRVVREGGFVEIAMLRRTFATGFTTLAGFEAERRSHTTWRLARGMRPRLLDAWRARRDGAVIETTMRMTMVVLQKSTRRRR